MNPLFVYLEIDYLKRDQKKKMAEKQTPHKELIDWEFIKKYEEQTGTTLVTTELTVIGDALVELEEKIRKTQGIEVPEFLLKYDFNTRINNNDPNMQTKILKNKRDEVLEGFHSLEDNTSAAARKLRKEIQTTQALKKELEEAKKEHEELVKINQQLRETRENLKIANSLLNNVIANIKD